MSKLSVNLSHPVHNLVQELDMTRVIVFPEQAPGTEFIDKAVVDGALNYIVRKQKRAGQLPIVGRVHNFRLLVCTHTHSIIEYGSTPYIWE